MPIWPIKFRTLASVKSSKIAIDRNGGLLTKLGGPGGLIIHNDTAVVLERAGRLTRVEGPGFPSFRSFETIYDIIDLRPKRWVYPINAMTIEGIDLTWEVEVQYQIIDDGKKPTDKVPYPFSAEAVFRAATGKWRRETGRPQDIDWEGRLIISQTEGILRSILAHKSLDELVGLSEADQRTVREVIQEELEKELSQGVPMLGAKILQVKPGNLKVNDEITQQWIKDWQNRWQQWSKDQLAEQRADTIRTYELAKMKAQLMPVETVMQELQKIESEQDILSVMLIQLFAAMVPSDVKEDNNSILLFLLVEAILNKLTQSRLDQDHVDQPANKLIPVPSEAVAREKITQFRRSLIPILGRIPAGQEKPFSTKGASGYLRQIDELEFEIFGQSNQRLKAQPLMKNQLDFNQEDNFFAMKVSGDSMDRAGICSGDYIILQKSVPGHPTNGDIVAVAFQDEHRKFTLKRISFGSNIKGVLLQPESSNLKHEPRLLPRKAFAGNSPAVKILGIAVAVLKLQ